MNTYPGLTWEFHEPTDKVDFMDLTISISKGQISTSLYEKPLNLHLYIPPHSAHPPGLLPGIVHSTLFRIYTLCSDNDDKLTRTKVFFKRLVARGYKSDQIKPLFYKAITRAKLYSGPIDRTANDDTSVILHLPFHPNDPPLPQNSKGLARYNCITKIPYATTEHAKPPITGKMQYSTHAHSIPTPHELGQPTITSQPKHFHYGPACLVLLPYD